MPSLYAADLTVGKPTKISAGKNNKKTPGGIPPQRENSPIPSTTQGEESKPKKQRPPMSEETKAKLKEARDRRKLEKEREVQAAKEAALHEEAMKQAESAALAAKKAAAAQKRKETLARKKAEYAEKTGEVIPSPPPSTTEAPVKKPRQRKRKESPAEEEATPSEASNVSSNTRKRAAKGKGKAVMTIDPDDPPRWLIQQVESTIQERKEMEGQKASKKKVREETHAAAKDLWKDDFMRDKLTGEMDNHSAKLYKMIWGRTADRA